MFDCLSLMLGIDERRRRRRWCKITRVRLFVTWTHNLAHGCSRINFAKRNTSAHGSNTNTDTVSNTQRSQQTHTQTHLSVCFTSRHFFSEKRFLYRPLAPIFLHNFFVELNEVFSSSSLAVSISPPLCCFAVNCWTWWVNLVSVNVAAEAPQQL